MAYRNVLLSAVASVVAFAGASAASATTFPIGSPNFFITAGNPFASSITAVFFNTPATASFDDSFTFTIPTQSGFGSGSISTSFSGPANQLTISSLTINNVAYPLMATANGQSLSVGGIPITAGVLNTIRVVGTTVAGAGSYSGTATFVSGAVPEMATWAMMVAGFGMVGAAMRSRRTSVTFA